MYRVIELSRWPPWRATVIAEHCKWIIYINSMYRNICKVANIMFFDPINLILTLVLPKNNNFKAKNPKWPPP